MHAGWAEIAADSPRLNNAPVRIDLRNTDRVYQFRIELRGDDRPAIAVPPPEAGHRNEAGELVLPREMPLQWEKAFDEAGYLRRCPVCGCREVFVRRDFPQKLGMAVVVVAGVIATALFAMNKLYWAMGVLGATVVIDAIAVLMAKRCLVCHRCRSEFRDTPIAEDHEGFDLAVGEKYRPVRQEGEA